jgi:hypothetical protein
MTSTQFLSTSLLAVGIIAGSVASVHLRDSLHADRGAVFFNQEYIEAIRNNAIDLERPQVVFDYVFSQLPDTVHVYPTENYYYFRFYTGSQAIWGNIRLDTADRDEGLVSFAYFGAHNQSQQPADLDFSGSYKQLSAADGVLLLKDGPLRYTMTYRGKSVVFELNDVPQSLPEGMPLADGERFIARTFDESGFQFALLFDTIHEQFRFILDETVAQADVLSAAADNLLIGHLSGFAFWRDPLGRKVLMGVNADNIRQNNYYDGPFDQLADNFVTGTTLRDAMKAAYPYLRGRIDERGVFLNDDGQRLSSRLAITPYTTYRSPAELRSFIAYCEENRPPNEQLACLTYDFKNDAPVPDEGETDE